MNELYRRMKAQGLDVKWYEKAKRLSSKAAKSTETALNDGRCSLLSIYLIDQQGRLWTTTPEGKTYMIVRYTKSKPKKSVYACVSCNTYYKTYEAATKHYQPYDS
jgi:hypothetical protein